MVQEESSEKFLETINMINFQKWHSKVRIVISKDFEFEVIALVASPFQHPTSEEVVVSKVIAQNNYTNQCLHVIGKLLDRMEEKVEKKVILQPGNPSKPSPALEKPLVKLPTTRQANIKSKDQTALEICL